MFHTRSNVPIDVKTGLYSLHDTTKRVPASQALPTNARSRSGKGGGDPFSYFFVDVIGIKTALQFLVEFA